ncbi:restriction endonuclease subunit S [Vibrio fluvialis]
MGKYQTYAEYTASNATWLDKYPSHWRLTQVKYGYQVVLGKMLQKSPKSSIDSLKPYLKAQNIQPKGVDTSRVDSMWFSPEELHKLRLQKGDVLVSEGGDVGRSAIWNNELAECYIQNAINRVRPLGQNCSRYFNYWIYSLKSSDFINILCNKATIAHYTAEKLEASPLLLPSSVEQTQIANFLDHETAKIDTLIEKQQQLIKLLKEKRQAVISHAVTKGLNPQAPMKNSGVEWLGEVPEHWAVMKFNHCAQIRNGLVDPKGTRYRDMVLYAPNHIEKASGKVLYRETASEQGADSNKYLCYQGEVIYSKIRPALAKVAICTEELALCSADMYPISCINGLTNEWLYWFMLSDSFTKAVVLDSDRVAMPKVNRESLGDYKIPFPTESEQSDISSHIKAQTQKLDVLEAKANHAIKLMQERRIALISAAVTGKIDVRNWQAPTYQDQALEQTA